MIDAHLHVVNFSQTKTDLGQLLRRMDAINIERAVIFGLPVTKEWSEWESERPDYYLSDNSRSYPFSLTDVLVADSYLGLSAQQRARFCPMMCGFCHADQRAADHAEMVAELYPGVFRGFGELLCRHDDLTNLTYGPPWRANHPALHRVYRLAARHRVPVLIHHNLTSIGGRGGKPRYIKEVTEAFEQHPETTFVWAHCGVSQREDAARALETAREFFERFPNVNVDFSWAVFDREVCPGGKSDLRWLEFTEEYADRICLGSDALGDPATMASNMGRYEPWLKDLSQGTVERVCSLTAHRLYFGGAALGGEAR